MSADEFGKGIKQDPAAVLKNELPVLQVGQRKHERPRMRIEQLAKSVMVADASDADVYSLMRLGHVMSLVLLRLQGLDFDLIVFPPYRALEGFCCDMEVSTVTGHPPCQMKTRPRCLSSRSWNSWVLQSECKSEYTSSSLLGC